MVAASICRSMRRSIRRWAKRALFFSLVLVPALSSAELPAEVAQALQQAGIPDSQVAVLVQELGNPLPLLAHGEAVSFNPASVMKLVTTLAALDSLGPVHTFKTRVYRDGPLLDGVLHGNLVFQGGGDPALTLERFWLLLRELRQRGVREIRGDILLDTQYYQIDAIDPGAFDQAPLRPYNAPPSAMLVNFNLLNLRLSAAGEVIGVRLEPTPAEQNLSLVNQLQKTDAACNGARERLTSTKVDASLILVGAFPSECGEQTFPLNLLPPDVTFGTIFNELWQSLGGELVGEVQLGVLEPSARLLIQFESPPLSHLVRDINKHSNNVMAKMLFLNLGAARFDAPATLEKGEQAIRAWVNEAGLKMPELVLENGSGLSRIERISAASLANMLSYAATRPVYYEFASSLPAVGLEGTQKGRLNGSAAEGAAWLKSGSLNGVRNLAGYLLGLNGSRRILIMLINHPKASAAAEAQAKMLNWSMQ
jgi:D-alanyl-D-alanine carboxypeptidase/D-alanyl-D-alanine-endopeptidase (penicillin-binding protein 4)